jgi:glycosyltransferase involved in cell wall biosynthesis
MIVKDEQALFPGALASVSFADEIIVGIDSRTTDSTVLIARKAGARVHDFDWEDSFSAARNLGIKKARKDWILIIDADDRVTSWGHYMISQTMRQPRADVDAYGFQIQNRRLDDTVQEVDALPSIRLFPNHRGIHYENRVHEVLRAKDGSPLRLGWLRGGIGMVTYGYDPAIYQLRDKDRRNTTLLAKQLQEQPHDRVSWYELACQHSYEGRMALACEAATIAMQLPGNLRPELVKDLEKILNSQSLDTNVGART